MSFRSLLLIALPLLSIAHPPNWRDENAAAAHTGADIWEKTGKKLSPEPIGGPFGFEARYRHGIFDHVRCATTAIRSYSRASASGLVDQTNQEGEVKDNLRKRQDSNPTGDTASSDSPTGIASLAPTSSSTSQSTSMVISASTSSVTSSSASSLISSLTSIGIPSSTAISLSTNIAISSSTVDATPTLTSDSSDTAFTPEPTSSLGQSSHISDNISADTTSHSPSHTSFDESTTSPGENSPSLSVGEPSLVATRHSSHSSRFVNLDESSSTERGNTPNPTITHSSAGSSYPLGSQIVPASASLTSGREVETGVLIPVEISTTVEGRTVVRTSAAFETKAPTSVTVMVTSVDDQGSTVVHLSTAPAAFVVVTDSQGRAATTAIPVTGVTVASGGRIVGVDAATVTSTDSSGVAVVLTSPTDGGIYTVTNALGEVVTVTYRPDGGTVSQLKLQTLTLPDGEVSVITSYAAVGGPVSEATAEIPSSTPTVTPGLQSGSAVPSRYHATEIAMVVVGAAIGMAGFII